MINIELGDLYELSLAFTHACCIILDHYDEHRYFALFIDDCKVYTLHVGHVNRVISSFIDSV